MKQANKKNRKRKSSKRKTSLFQIIALITIGIALIFLAAQPNFSKRSAKKDSQKLEIPFTKEGELSFISKQNNSTIKTIDIEIAEGLAETAQGLMYRYSMSDQQGMLFIMDIEKTQDFWMKETYISLDIIYVNSNFEIVRIHERAVPLSEQNIPSIKKAKYVVEVIGGFCDKFDIEEGDIMNFKRTQ
ncbi:DUF192 domain-containing protein [Marinifilum flexuosum]|uniref:DUF192 domain-containing protein n=1 Tax=Marinifilum flexuosum TaxID=1117708 RepID=A0A419WF42_9BACT|nr:DUF192 domain-containing protein [Marinifilum flexuosum]RKD94110.1 hypothetical protein BXY64_4273 [Marinifilum flexuosum]